MPNGPTVPFNYSKQGREAKLRPQHPYTIESLKQLVTLYESWPRPDEAEKWRAKLPKTKAADE